MTTLLFFHLKHFCHDNNELHKIHHFNHLQVSHSVVSPHSQCCAANTTVGLHPPPKRNPDASAAAAAPLPAPLRPPACSVSHPPRAPGPCERTAGRPRLPAPRFRPCPEDSSASGRDALCLCIAALTAHATHTRPVFSITLPLTVLAFVLPILPWNQ